ncbi:pantoate--beta-alanine ligase [Clostridium weizhouense]|uniref:Pantothenate synthetase n=1 Tax=Clostridium weizhouense TaxID=2859781 RepID=A0ABS7APB5_9CLOT|nr:pantoate--beta-alanine ligase [Clostridium weizhouense]MBW6409531.1 pantoate--beta-alanine ligase [Clostridium weizhouense]
MLLKEIKDIRSIIKDWKKDGLTIGYVPTMGCLHEGHKSLIEKAVSENDKVVVSVFVNPTQFGPNEDYDSYPKNIDEDLEICKKSGASIVFNPDKEEMYFNNKSTTVSVSELTNVLCGAKRPGHFDGVCLVLSKFFNIITPDKAYFGEKDFQQIAVVKRMVRDLNINIEILSCPIVREKDGLAKSSRNVYLSKEERKAALVLNRSLSLAKEELKHGERNSKIIKDIIVNELNKEPLAKIDYVEIVDSESLNDLEIVNTTALIPIAVYIGKTRLIDNFIFNI